MRPRLSRVATVFLLAVTPAVATAQSPRQTVKTPETVETLGGLERQAVDEALAARALAVDPSPAGKRVGHIHVYNHEVFSSRDSYFQLLNIFHRTTREQIIRREVLLQPGATYDATIVDETVRNLRDAEFSSLVVIVPVVSATAGQVDLLVVTRDVWSLRFNTDFKFDDGGGKYESVLLYLTTSLAENNLFGWRKRLSLNFNLYRRSYEVGPTYYDSNVAGTRMRFSGAALAVYDRDTTQREGHSVSGRLDYPLWSLSRKWGAHVSASHADLVYRFLEAFGRGLRYLPLRGLHGADPVPLIYRYRQARVDGGVTRSLTTGPVIHRVGGAYRFGTIRPRFHESFPSGRPGEDHRLQTQRPPFHGLFPRVDADIRQAFAEQFMPRSEQDSSVYLSYGLFTPRYRVYRDFDTFDLREDSRLGPTFSASVSRSLEWLGSTYTTTGVGGSAGWTMDIQDGLQSLAVSWSGQVREGRWEDEKRGVGLTLATPMLRRLVRVVASGSLSVWLHNSRPSNQFYTVGNEDGLRGYGVSEFAGNARYVAHLEARSRPVAFRALRGGVVLFYDVGDAAPRLSTLRSFHDVGVGLRLLIPQLNFYVLRVDFAVPLQSSAFTPAGFPGRWTLGFRQVF